MKNSVKDVVFPKYTVVQYIRNKKGVPQGVVVAVKNSTGYDVGYSLCRKSDREYGFHKSAALKIALHRAGVPQKGVEKYLADFEPAPGAGIPHDVRKIIPEFTDRCRKYYKVDV